MSSHPVYCCNMPLNCHAGLKKTDARIQIAHSCCRWDTLTIYRSTILRSSYTKKLNHNYLIMQLVAVSATEEVTAANIDFFLFFDNLLFDDFLSTAGSTTATATSSADLAAG